jgi:tetratricopeptide (TPR) repeat protein
MNLTDSNARDNNFFATRGMFYFALTDYANAEKDLNASLAIDSNTVQGIYFKAWILEIKKDYDGANRLYTYLATLTKTNEFNIFAAIANRKKNGR